jgi:hypothetical protein
MIFQFGLVMAIVSSCLVGCADSHSRGIGNSQSLTTNTYSSQLDTDRQKIQFLSRYFKLLSPIEATEFHINVHDNDFAPADWDIEAVLKVSPSNLKFWTSETSPLNQPVDITWGYALIAKNRQRWNLKSKPQIYRRLNGDGIIAVFKPEGVIFKSYHSH